MGTEPTRRSANVRARRGSVAGTVGRRSLAGRCVDDSQFGRGVDVDAAVVEIVKRSLKSQISGI